MLTIETDELLDAIRKNDNEKVSRLLQKNPSLASARDPNGVSAIFLALYRGNKRVAQEIGSKKTGLDIFEAAGLGDVGRLKTIIDKDKSSVLSYSPDGFTALALASYIGQKQSVEYLIEKGADPNAVARNDTGFTPLTGAASNNHNEIAKILVKNGADVNYSYEGGFTPLIHAAESGNLELAEFLLQNGADPNARNAEGKTAKIFAQERGHREIAQLLEKHRAQGQA